MDAFYFLEKLESSGFEAYIVGGYVRDNLLGIHSNDIDIATNATPEQIGKIFNLKIPNRFGSVYFDTEKFHIDITTFRRELEYKNRRPTKVEFINSLNDDLKRRDFTINALALNSKKELKDPLGGLNDLKSRLIKSIGSPDDKFKEDPLRILRAIRLATTLDFEIEKSTFKSIEKNKQLLKTLSYERKKQEITKIITSPNALKGIELLNNLKLLNILEIDISKHFKPTENYLGAWALLKFSNNYPFTKQEKHTIDTIRTLLHKKTITHTDLFEFSLDTCLTAGSILGLDTEKLKKDYENLPIKSLNELNINGKEIMDILKIKEGPIINSIKIDLLKMILSGNLTNDKNSIKKYINKKWK